MISKFLFNTKTMKYMTKFKLHLCMACKKILGALHWMLLPSLSPCIPSRNSPAAQRFASAYWRQKMKEWGGREKRNSVCDSFCVWFAVSVF